MRYTTLGQYYDADSVIHRLDPRVKLVFTIVYIVSLYLGNSPFCYIFAGLFLAVVIRLSKVPVRYMLRGLKAVIFLLLFTAFFNIFLSQGDVVFQWGFITITRQGIETAVRMAVRLVLLIMGSSLMTLTTTPNDLTDGLEKGLGFLKVFHVPVHEIGMMMSIALRFIPILVEEAGRIMMAQKARGADFDSGGLIKKAKAMIPLLIPLFVAAFRRANDLAQAMEARCYHGGNGRTKLHPLKYGTLDFIAYGVLLLYLALMIVLKIVTKS